MVLSQLRDEAEFLLLSLLRRALLHGMDCILPVVRGQEDVITLRYHIGGNQCVVDIWKVEGQPVRYSIGNWSGVSRLGAFVRVCDFLRLPVEETERQLAEREGSGE